VKNSDGPFRTIPSNELKIILAEHETFVRTRGKEGTLADLSRADLRAFDLSHRNLAQANLEKSNLIEAHLEGTDLTSANLNGAHLCNAFMRDAVLKGVKGLIAKELAGADICCTDLPNPITEFSELKNVTEASKNATVVFITMLSACLYCLIALSSVMPTKDGVKLPVLDAAITMPAFQLIGAVILVAMFAYFHLQLLRLWELLADLPAIFPDGISLDKKTYPWLFNGVVAAYLPRLSDRRPKFMAVQKVVAMFLGCWTIPVTLAAFWVKSLQTQEQSMTRHVTSATTIYHAILVVLTIATAVYCHGLAKATLLHERPRLYPTIVVSLVATVLLAVGGAHPTLIRKYVFTGLETQNAEACQWLASSNFANSKHSEGFQFLFLATSCRPISSMAQYDNW
jgi:hypothetical protein